MSPLFNNFLRTIKPLFQFLVDNCGYELVHEEAADVFDNGQLLYRSPRLWINVVRDRGAVLVDAGAPLGPSTFDDDILRLLVAQSAHYTQPTREARPPAAETAAFLRQHLSALEALFSPAHREETIECAKRLQEERVRVLFGPSLGGAPRPRDA